MIFPKQIYLYNIMYNAKIRKRRKIIADVTTSFEPSFPFAANLFGLFILFIWFSCFT